MRKFNKSHKLDNVYYDIRGPVVEEANRMQNNGIDILQLNTGNPPAFNMMAPDAMIQDILRNLKNSEAYCHHKGLFPARNAIVQYYQTRGLLNITVDNVYIGNGSSELILMCLQALCNEGDEILIPKPDYPLWTASAFLSGGKAVHYHCDEENGWLPDIDDIKSKINENTKAIVIINPNNPTGAVYPPEYVQQIVDLAVENELIIFADEIYDKIIYDDLDFKPISTMTDETLVITFNGLSKSHRIPGFRVGWCIISGNTKDTKDYLEGIDILASSRLCSNVPAQQTIQTALGGYQSIENLVKPSGRLYKQRDIVYERLNAIDGIECVKPRGALYAFPKIDIDKFNITDDVKFALDFLKQEKVLIVQGTGFNWDKPDHFRIVFLPNPEELTDCMDRLERFMHHYKQN